MEQAPAPGRRPVLIAHRGAPLVSGHPENTRAAFEGALAAGFTRVETDLRLTDDGRIVLAHDLEQTIRAESLENAWPALRAFGWINLELKDPVAVPPLAAWLDAHVREAPLRERLVISSFDPGSLILARHKLPWVRLAALFLPEAQDFSVAELASPSAIHLTKEFAAAHPTRPKALGELPVNVFTVNDQSWLERMPDWVDGVFTDSLLP